MRQKDARSKTLRIGEIDALRGIAAVAVLLYHYTSIYPRLVAKYPFTGIPQIDFGYFGVELFFIISGFVIFFSAARARSVRDFFWSRFARLFPAYWGAVLITGLLHYISGDNPSSMISVIVANLTMLQAFIGLKNLDTSYWTLAFELSFYVLVMLALRNIRHFGGRIEPALLLWLAEATFIRVMHIPIPYRLKIAMLIDYGQFFVLGITFYLMHVNAACRLTFLVAGWALLLSLLGADPDSPANGFHYYFLCSTACAAIVVYAVQLRPRLLMAWPLQFLGSISYSLYLVHGTLGFFVIQHMLLAGSSDLAAILAAIVISFAIAYMLNITIEVPGRILISRWLGLHKPSLPEATAAEANRIVSSL